MIKFPSIDSFRHVNAHIKRAADFHGKPLPTITYEGRVKLHGTNAGIHYIPESIVDSTVDIVDETRVLGNFINKMIGRKPHMVQQTIQVVKESELIPQSRERVLSVGKEDNAGFAAWVAENRDYLDMIFGLTFDNQEVTVYGEWCGGNIQKGVGLNQLPKMFVVFGYIDHSENWVDAESNERGILRPFPYFVGKVPPSHLGIEGQVDEFEIEDNNTKPEMYHIDLVRPVTIEIDFANPNAAVEKMEELTAQYEAECPWAKMWGVSGVGEGLVWTPASIYNREPDSARMVFKTKGDKHGNPATKNKVKVAIEPEKMGDFNALIEEILPLWRLKQGIATMNERMLDLTKTNTGAYLKWVAEDVLKEEKDTIEASGFELKVVMAEVSRRTRQFYFNHTEWVR